MYFQAKNDLGNQTKFYSTFCGDYKEGEVKIGKNSLLVYIADDKCKKDLGLSGKETLDNEEGMMFIFEKLGKYPFWMKDMKFSIDILWINDNFKVVGIEKNVSPKSYPKTYGNNYPALYVLETQNGYLEKNNIKLGQKINFYMK